MFNKSKLQNAKQKISKLKEKYFNNSNLTREDKIIDVHPRTVSNDNSKLEDGQSKITVSNAFISPISEIKISPRVETINLFESTENIVDENLSFQTLSSTQNLIDAQHSDISSNHSHSEHSYCSKITNKTLKTESIILSELSNQFENICFLSSSSDEENTNDGVHPASSSVPLTGRNLHNSLSLDSLQMSTQHLYRNSELKQINDGVPVQREEVSSSELSEVQSDVNSTVFGDKENSVTMYSNPVNVEANHNNSECNNFQKKEKEINKDSEVSENSSYKSIYSNKKQTSISHSKFENYSSSQTHQGNTEPSESPKTISLLSEIKTSQLPSKTSHKRKPKSLKNQTPERSDVSSLKLCAKQKNYEKSKRISKCGEIIFSKNVDISTISDVDFNESNYSLHNKSRCKYRKGSKTSFKHSTNVKPLISRPMLKSCVLIKPDESYEANKFLSTQGMFPSQLEGCGYEEVISQLMWSQVQLTRQFLHSHHQMYLTCCQAVKLLSEKQNSSGLDP